MLNRLHQLREARKAGLAPRQIIARARKLCAEGQPFAGADLTDPQMQADLAAAVIDQRVGECREVQPAGWADWDWEAIMEFVVRWLPILLAIFGLV